jgi:acyl-CoA synthetase (AMP-forming)/AMP-acid ligase II
VSRDEVLSIRVPPFEERRRQIEAEPLPRNIAVLLDEAAAEAPQQLVWNFFESAETINYGELRERTNSLANGMAAAGIAKGTHVGVMLPNIAAFPMTWLALARLGAVMIPMNIAYTPREMEYVLENGDAEWLIIDHSCLKGMAGLSRWPERLAESRIVVVGGAARGFRSWSDLSDSQRSDCTATTAVELDDRMAIQYTSGTTGFPKGCVLSHRYWLTLGKVAAWRDGRVFKRVLAATPFFYLDTQWLLMMTMFHRGTLFVAKKQSSSRYLGWIRDHRIDFCPFPEMVFKQPPDPRDRQNEIIRVNVYDLHKEIHAALEERFDFIAREAYGMTEAGTCLFLPIEATNMVGSGSCGKPSPFRDARIVDMDGKPVAPGEIGELQVCGPGMLEGYYKNPEATSAAFVDGWFRTGDLFHQDERGYFYIVGRIKDMIRRSGENIAAREVEAVLRELPQIVEAAVVPVPDSNRGEEVKSYVVLQPGLTRKEVPTDRIIAHCEANLARFKVPRYIAYCDDLPKTPSGKIAKKLLTQGVTDLRLDSYDREGGVWR